MKNIVFFVILAILTVAALVGWNAVRQRNATSTSATIQPSGSPTPTNTTGTAVGRGLGSVGTQTATGSGVVADTTKGGVTTSLSTPLSTASGVLGVNTRPTVTPTPVLYPVSNVVTYTDSGFNPKTLSIKTGTMVKFVNQSSKKLWVVSQEVAGGKKLEGMNMGVSVGRDGSYEFQFNTLGTWGYIDQNNQSQSGTIVVNQ